MNYLGDYAEDDTVYLMFNTFSSDDPSASCTITNFINTDVHVHKDDGLGQRNNAAGITVSVDFDGITGSHMIKIDTNDNTVAGFWVAGHDYFVRIEGTTVDAATINAMVGSFSIENRFMRGTDSAALATGVNMTQISGDTTAANNLELYCDGTTAQPVNVTELGGVVQSLTDIKDFADSGYDPIAHYTLGVTTCTTTTTNTDMVGTDNAALATGVDVTSIHGSALTETVGGYLAAGFTKLFDVATPVLVASEVMRGTDGANTAVPDVAGTAPTATEIRTEMEGAGTKLTLTLEDTADLQGNQAAWATATTTALNAQGKLDVNAEVDTALADIKLDHLVNIAVDTDWGTTVHLDSVIGHIADVGTAATFSRTTDALEAVRNRGDAEWMTATTTALNAQGKLDVNAEVVDVIRTDVTAEMAQAAPPATPTMEEMMSYIYFSLRNKTETTASENAVYNNDGDTKLFKAVISDNGTTFAKAEYVSGV